MSAEKPLTDKESFEADVTKYFLFLERDLGIPFSGVREKNGDPRDTVIDATYANEQVELQIGWNELELSLVVVVRLFMAKVPKKKQGCTWSRSWSFCRAANVALSFLKPITG